MTFFILLLQTNALFERELSAMNVTKPFSRFAPETYDAVWSIALALKGAEESWRNESRPNRKRKRKKLDFFDYTRKDLAKDFLEQFGRLKFQGISVINSSALSVVTWCKHFSPSTGKCFVWRCWSSRHDRILPNSIRPTATCCFILTRDWTFRLHLPQLHDNQMAEQRRSHR